MIETLMASLGKGASEVLDMLRIPAAERAALERRLAAK